MAEQYNNSQLFNPLVASAESLGKSISKVEQANKANVANSFSNVRGIATGKMVNPDINKLGTITTPYQGSTNYEKVHPGVDIANVAGTPIPAFTSGKVVEEVTGQGWTPNNPSFGNYIVIQDNNGNYQRYSHLQNAFVKVGDTISKGTELGTMGGTGSTYGANANQPGIHLDYRIYDAAKKYYDPFQYLSNAK